MLVLPLVNEPLLFFTSTVKPLFIKLEYFKTIHLYSPLIVMAAGGGEPAGTWFQYNPADRSYPTASWCS